jgi:hypothetical protein
MKKKKTMKTPRLFKSKNILQGPLGNASLLKKYSMPPMALDQVCFTFIATF